MKPSHRLFSMVLPHLSLAATLAVSLLFASPCAFAGAAPVSVILDTDIGPDCGDMGAVALLHGLADKGEIRILATMNCISGEWGARGLSALNTFYGRPEIPVGTLKHPDFLADRRAIGELIGTRYTHSFPDGKDAPDATALYRRILSQQPDGSVALVAVGPLKNLANLLRSAPDESSPLSGKELVGRKVSELSCMGGWYPRHPNGREEWNFAQDPASARLVAEEWPTPIMFSDAEIGGGIMTGRRLALEAPEYNPVAIMYGLFPDIRYGDDRESWDQLSILYSARGLQDYWSATPPGRLLVDDKGGNVFITSENRGHRFMRKKAPSSVVEQVVEDLMLHAKEGPLVFEHEIALFAKDGFGTVSGSGGENSARNAFDRSKGTAWHTGKSGGCLEFQSPDGRAYPVTSYVITSRHRGAQSWKLTGSADGGKTWQTLDEQRNALFNDEEKPCVYRIANAIPFNGYRLTFEPGENADIAEISLRERVENTAGIGVSALRLDEAALSLPVNGRATLNASVLPANALDKQLVWTSDKPGVSRVQRIGKNTAVVIGISVGTCTITATSRDGGKAAVSQVTVTPNTLPEGWSYEEINAPHVPGAATHRDGVFTLIGGGSRLGRWWQREFDQFSMLTRRHEGDGAISARITSLTQGSPRAMAGVMFRESAERESRFVAIGIQPSGELILTWRDKPEDEGPEMKLGKFPLPLHLKLTRRGDTYEAYTSADGVEWGAPLGKHISASQLPAQKVGFWVSAKLNPATSTAQFEKVIIAKP